MKLILVVILSFVSIASHAANPLVQYAWHNQVGDSQLVIYDDGSVTHHERQMYELQKIPSKKLSSAKIEKIKTLVSEIAASRITQSMMDASMGSMSGTLELSTPKGMTIVEGVVRDIHDVYRAKTYKSNSLKMIDLKEIIFDYTTHDMEF